MLTKRELARTLAALAGPLIVLSAGEVCLRAAGFEYLRSRDRAIVWNREEDAKMRLGDDLYRFDLQSLWSPRPGALLPWANGERVNRDGYRGPPLETERPKGTLRIAVLGGAGTFGLGVRWEDTYSARLASMLSQRVMPTQVLDAGVADYSVVQSLWRYRELVRAYRPQVVVLSLTSESCLQQAPQDRTDPERLARLNARPPNVKAGFDWQGELRLAHLARWLATMYGEDYWKERAVEFHERRLEKTVGSLEWPGVRRLPIGDYSETLARLLRETHDDGARLIFLSIPHSPSLPDVPVLDVYTKSMYDLADREHVPVLDARNAYVEAVHADILKEDLFLDDKVPSECGHLLIANALADLIDQGIARRH